MQNNGGVVLEMTKERWLTFKEAAVALHEEFGFRVHHQTLERYAGYGRKRGAMPSKVNFGKRQVQMSQIIPWLREQGYIEQ
jgi:ribosomal protein S19E (S16A)